MMQAAVAAGGASAAAMHFAVTCDEDELPCGADECLGVVLSAAVMLLDVSGIAEGEDDRRRLRTAIADYVDVVEGQPVPGRCRICGCVDDHACDPPCAWADAGHTLCDNPACLDAAGVAAIAESVS